MYAMGMSTRSMPDYIRKMYAMEISAAETSRITDSVLPIYDILGVDIEAKRMFWGFIRPRMKALDPGYRCSRI